MSINHENVLPGDFQFETIINKIDPCSESDYMLPCNTSSIKVEDNDDICIKEEPLNEMKSDVNYLDKIDDSHKSAFETVLIKMDPFVLEECEEEEFDIFISDKGSNKKEKADPTRAINVSSKNFVNIQQNRQENINTIVNFKCKKCQQKFKYKESFLSHLSGVHGISSSVICDYCGKTFATKKSYNVHIKKIHKEVLKQIKCTECNKTYVSKKALNAHLNTIHSKGKTFFCQSCEKAFVCSSQLRKHSKVHQEKKLTCDVCKKRFSNKTSLKLHLEVVHAGIKKFTCYVCNVKFGYSSALKRHMKHIHHSAYTYKLEACTICNKRMRKYYVKEHIKAVHQGYKKYSCDKCNQKYSSRKSMLIHVCPGQRKLYVCDYCGFTSKKKGSLVVHINGHNTQSCDECNKDFKMKWMLNRHKKEVHDSLIKTYICSVCNKNFRTKAYLTRHVNYMHSNSKRGVNDSSFEVFRKKCLKGYENDDNKNQFKYTCDLCKKKFKVKKYISAHISYVHQHKKLFACKRCDKLFPVFKYLKQHMKLKHDELIRSPCSLCDRSFSFQQSLVRHMRNVHHIFNGVKNRSRQLYMYIAE